MISDRDKLVVENMALSGMDPESLYSSFPMFPKEDIKAIFEQVRDREPDDEEFTDIKLNCS